MKTADLKDWLSDWRLYVGEFFGTFLFVFIASYVVLVNALYGEIGVVGVALAIGISYTSLIFTCAHLSGGYLNPAITVALWLVQKLPASKTIFFLLAQVFASFLAAWALMLFFGIDGIKHALGAPTLGLNISLTQAVIAEAIFTAGFVFVMFSTTVDRRGPISFGPLALGLYVVAASIALIPISGAALNPVRALGPVIVAGSADTLAVWLIGPLMGSLFAVFYELVFLKKKNR